MKKRMGALREKPLKKMVAKMKKQKFNTRVMERKGKDFSEHGAKTTDGKQKI